MQPEPQQVRTKNPHAQFIGSLGGKRRAAVQTAQQRSEHARHAAFAQHHPYQFKLQRERAEELARMVKQAIDDYLPSDKRNMMEP
jgi:transposase